MRDFDDVFLLGCRMRMSYAFNDIVYGLYTRVSDSRLREIVSGLTAREARLIRGRRLPAGTRLDAGIVVNGQRYMGTFVLVWNHMRNVRAVRAVRAGAGGAGAGGAAPVVPTLSRDSVRTLEHCRKTFAYGHARLVRIMDELEGMRGFSYMDEPEWSFPKGRARKASGGESEIDTALREFYEETHCDLDRAFVRARLLRDGAGEIDFIDETIETHQRIFYSRYFVFVDPRPLPASAISVPIKIHGDVEIADIFWRRTDAFVEKWARTEPEKIDTIRRLMRRRF